MNIKLSKEHKSMDTAALIRLLDEKSEIRMKQGECYVQMRSEAAAGRFRCARQYEQAIERELVFRLGLPGYPGRELLLKLARKEEVVEKTN